MFAKLLLQIGAVAASIDVGTTFTTTVIAILLFAFVLEVADDLTVEVMSKIMIVIWAFLFFGFYWLGNIAAGTTFFTLLDTVCCSFWIAVLFGATHVGLCLAITIVE